MSKRDAMSIATLNDIFFAAVERNLDRMMLHREAGAWLPISSQECGHNVARTTRALHRFGLRKGDRVALIGFGTFSVSQRKARNGRNPQTGATIKIAARRVAKFTPGAELKKAVNRNK